MRLNPTNVAPSLSVLDAIARRHSVKEYRPDSIPREILLSLLDAAHQAPSSNNLQPWEFVVVDQPEWRSRLSEAVSATNRKVVETAGATFVCLGSMRQQDALADNLEKRWITPETPPDVRERQTKAIARQRTDQAFRREQVLKSIFIGVSNLSLAAVQYGLGTQWMGGFDESKVREVLSIPDDYLVAVLVSVGWPAQPIEPKPRMRRPLEEIYSFNTFGVK